MSNINKINIDDLREEKQKLRTRILRMLRSLKKAELKEKSKKIEELIEEKEEYKRARTVMMFWPLKEEPDLRGLIRKSKASGKKLVLPKVNGRDLDLYEFVNEENLNKSDLNVLEPKEENSKIVSIEDIEFVCVPGLAFDRGGHRMGRGKGFYDRFLTRLSPHTYTLGVCYVEQVTDNIPFNPTYDQAVKSIVCA